MLKRAVNVRLRARRSHKGGQFGGPLHRRIEKAQEIAAAAVFMASDESDFMSTSNTNSKIGAVFYTIWACLHFVAAYSVYVLGRSLDSSLVRGRVFQDAWNLLFFSIIAISVAVTLNWRNSVRGYWINFVTVGIADTGFIFFVLVEGYAPVWPGILGPVFWVLATIFSTIALLTRTKGATTELRGHDTAVIAYRLRSFEEMQP